MEQEDLVKQNYELAFHINSTLEEAKMLEMKDELERQISVGGGVITFSKSPEIQRFSYEIKHQKSSFFGYIHFSITNSEILRGLDEYLRLNPDVIRYIILKLESDEQRQKAVTRAAEHKERMERRAKQAQQKAATQKAEKAPDTKEMEKQLEDIIGNL